MKFHIFIFTLDVTLNGGVERVVANMANSFYGRGFIVHVVSLFKENKEIKYIINSNIKVKYIFECESYTDWRDTIKVKSNIYIRYKLSRRFTKLLYSYIDSELINGESAIVLCNSYLITPLYRHPKVSIIGLDHSRYPFSNMTHGLRHWLHTYMVNKFDMVTTLNTEEMDKWKTIGPPVYVIPNFLPYNWLINNVSSMSREKVILCMGRMNTDQKGFDRLIDVYALIARRHPCWKLIIYGTGILQQQYKERIINLGMQQYIVINDFTLTPQEEYQKASIYAMCSREEGFPMVLLEAGSQGLPIVAYDVDFGPRTIIKEGKTGYIIPDGNKEKFAKALEKLMSDDNLRNKMSEAIRKDIQSRYSEDVIMDKWIKLINSL